MIIVDVFVPGAAKTKGSLKVRNAATGQVTDSVIGSSQWRALVASQVRDDLARRHGVNPMSSIVLPWRGPVRVRIDVALPLPADPGQFAPLIRRNWWAAAMAIAARFGAPVWEQSGDVDKLARNVLDAIGAGAINTKMNGGAIRDDVYVCDLHIIKHTASATLPPGARIVIATDGYWHPLTPT